MTFNTESPRHRAAFTLLEVMLAVTILAVVMTAVYAVWSAGLAGWKRSSSVSENLQRQRIVMDTLAELTKSAVFFTSKDSLYKIVGEHSPNNGDMVSFVTGSDVLLPPSEALDAGMRRVTISLERDQYNRAYLAIANATALESPDAPESPSHVLCSDVSGFAVRYRDPRSGSMEEKWDEDTLPPSAIEYTVAFGANDGRTPPVIMTRTFELPVAQFALQAQGQALNQQDTTNTVSRREIDLTTGGGNTIDTGGFNQ
jgi:prepilin-type N-terminal cleavage/methylation domain-containing protein